VSSHGRPWSSGLHDRQTPLLLPLYLDAYIFIHYEFAFHLNDELFKHVSLS
jgi:hypothetical protein